MSSALLCCLVLAAQLPPPGAFRLDDSTTQVVAGDSFPGFESEFDSAPNLPSTEVEWAVVPRFDEFGFGVQSLDLRHTLLVGYGEGPPLEIAPGAALHGWSGPTRLDLPARVVDLYVDLLWRPWSSDLGQLSVGAVPGLYGDFERIDGKTFQWSGWTAGTLQTSPAWALMGGVAYVRQLESNWLPIGGAIWTPNDVTRFEFVFPRPRFSRRIESNDRGVVWCFLEGSYGGGAWSVLDTPSENVLVRYSDLRLRLGLEGFRFNGVEWRVDAGYVFSRDISVGGATLATPGDSFIIQGAFGF